MRAINPRGMPSGGLSLIEGITPALSLRDAIKLAPLELLGQDLMDAHGPEFRVLVKILDPGEAIVFHLHASDVQVARMKRQFRGHRLGKDEAYYFLDAPRGSQPYTHVGLRGGVTKHDLKAAAGRGAEFVLELSPSFYQQVGEGFFLPAAVPHRPGTALTLEIQQPSDVYTLLGDDRIYNLIDYDLSYRVGCVNAFRLRPVPVPGRQRGGEVATIFPIEMCRKFQGRRLRVSDRLVYSESLPFVILIWAGRGRLNGRTVAAGEEFFVAHDIAAHGIEIDCSGREALEAFTFLPGV
ncbi:MAG TPA: hypothetical protein VH518_07225 [Tepidisphaeraceae bacterium]